MWKRFKVANNISKRILGYIVWRQKWNNRTPSNTDLEKGERRGNYFHQKTNTKEDCCFLGNTSVLCTLLMVKHTRQFRQTDDRQAKHSLTHDIHNFCLQKAGSVAETVMVTRGVCRITFHNSTKCRDLQKSGVLSLHYLGWACKR